MTTAPRLRTLLPDETVQRDKWRAGAPAVAPARRAPLAVFVSLADIGYLPGATVVK